VIRRVLGWAGRHRAATAAIVTGGLAALVLGVVWFEPHKLFVDDRVDEALPGVSTTRDPSGDPPADPSADPESPAPPPSVPATPEELSRGAFRPLEHDVEGEALVLETLDGRRYLRFEDLDVSNGPDLVVYLSVLGADQGWHDAGDADYLDLGELKGNVGDQNYALPDDADLGRYRSVVIWCRRFSVGFAVAPIAVSG
jgi:electron transfer DM13